jgi:hypothetical protein
MRSIMAPSPLTVSNGRDSHSVMTSRQWEPAPPRRTNGHGTTPWTRTAVPLSGAHRMLCEQHPDPVVTIEDRPGHRAAALYRNPARSWAVATGPGVGVHDVLAATSVVCCGLEVLDSRFVDFRFLLPDVVADNTSASRSVLGSIAIPPAGSTCR